MTHRRLAILRLPFILPALALLLTACVPPRTTIDPYRAATYQREGEALAQVHKYAAAADKFLLAVSFQADDPTLALRAAEILEAAGRWEDAADIYRNGLNNPLLQDIHQELAYRLGLLNSSFLKQASRATEQLAQLPPGSIKAADLKAMLELDRGDARAALARLQQALAAAKDNDTRGTLSYHIALAQDRLGNEPESSRALFDAINLSQHQGTVKGIKLFWEEIRAREAEQR